MVFLTGRGIGQRVLANGSLSCAIRENMASMILRSGVSSSDGQFTHFSFPLRYDTLILSAQIFIPFSFPSAFNTVCMGVHVLSPGSEYSSV